MGFARTLGAGLRRDLVLDDDGVTLREGDASEKLSTLLGGGPTLAGPSMTPESALKLIAINAAVRLKVNAVRSIPMLVFREGDDGFKDYDEGRKNRYFPLVHEAPNPEQPADEMWSQVAGHLAYRANGYLWKERHEGGIRDGLVRGLWPVDPRRVAVKREKGVKVFEIWPAPGTAGEMIKLTAADIIHIKGGFLSHDGLKGVTAVHQCREELASHAAVREYLAHHLGRGANFTGYLYNDDKDVEIDTPEREAIEQKLIAPTRGARGSTRVPLFNAALKWQQIGMTLADQQFIELMGFGVADCALLQGVPPTLLNAPVRSGALTYRTTAEEDQRFLKYGVSPDLTAIEGALAADSDLYAGSPDTPEFRREAHLAMDTIARYQAHALAIRAGWKAPNEVRRAENMKPLEGGETLLRPGAQPDKETRELLELFEAFTGNGGNGTREPSALN